MPISSPTAATDRRIAKTRIALLGAMLDLLPERGWDNLNVQEICDAANVGRSTFYLHYASKEELLSEGLNSLRLRLKNEASMVNSESEPLAFLSGLIQHMVEQRKLFKAVIGKRSGHVIERRFRQMIQQLVWDEFARMEFDGLTRSITTSYVSGGLVDVFSWWLDAVNPPTPAALELTIRKFTDSVLYDRASFLGLPATHSIVA
jgi:AcrR family transcriptional regulator